MIILALNWLAKIGIVSESRVWTKQFLCVLCTLCVMWPSRAELEWRWPYEAVADVQTTWQLSSKSELSFVVPTVAAYKKQFFVTVKMIVEEGVPDCAKECSLGFYFSIENHNLTERSSGLLTKSFIAPNPICQIQLNVSSDAFTCFDFIKIPPEIIDKANVSSQGNVTIVGHAIGVGNHNAELSRVKLSVKLDVQAVPYTFDRWHQSGVNVSAIECFWNRTMRNESMPDAGKLKMGKLVITEDGKSVRIEYAGTAKALHDNKSSMGYRIRSMQLGIQEAVALTKRRLGLHSFPNITALLFVGDEAHFSLPQNLKDECDPGPIFAQNRMYTLGNPFVVVPDFSYFTHFWDGHDHGNSNDRWFELIEREKQLMERHWHGKLQFGKVRFDNKKQAAIFRGRLSGRRMGQLRTAVATCKLGNLLNASVHQNYVSRFSMCNDYQAIISIPGNGVWSWATKYNMLCNSISILVSPEELRGETWETRMVIGFRPWVHYLPLSVDPAKACPDLKYLLNWMVSHQEEAKQMALRSRDFVFRKLGKHNVLFDLGKILLDYATLQHSTPYNSHRNTNRSHVDDHISIASSTDGHSDTEVESLIGDHV